MSILDLSRRSVASVCSDSDFSFSRYGVMNQPQPKIALILNNEQSRWEHDCLGGLINYLYNQEPKITMPLIEVYGVRNNMRTLYDHVLPYIAQNAHEYQAVMTFGSTVSTVVAHQMGYWSQEIPQIFVCVDDPVGLGLSASDRYGSASKGGVCRVSPRYTDLIVFLQQVLSDRTTVVVPFDTHNTHTVAQEQTFLSRHLEQAGYDVSYVPLYQGLDDKEKIQSRLKTASMLCLDFDISLSSVYGDCVTLCQEQGVPLVSSDLSSVYHGAAFGAGAAGQRYGVQAARVLSDVLQRRKISDLLPVYTVTESPQVRFNEKVFAAQSVQLASELANALHARSIDSTLF